MNTDEDLGNEILEILSLVMTGNFGLTLSKFLARLLKTENIDF